MFLYPAKFNGIEYIWLGKWSYGIYNKYEGLVLEEGMCYFGPYVYLDLISTRVLISINTLFVGFQYIFQISLLLC